VIFCGVLGSCSGDCDCFSRLEEPSYSGDDFLFLFVLGEVVCDFDAILLGDRESFRSGVLGVRFGGARVLLPSLFFGDEGFDFDIFRPAAFAFFEDSVTGSFSADLLFPFLFGVVAVPEPPWVPLRVVTIMSVNSEKARVFRKQYVDQKLLSSTRS